MNRFNSAAVLAELTWNNRKRSDLYGFEALCKLRADYRVRWPIAICSFLSRKALERRSPILDFPQHPFVRLPAHPEAIRATLEAAPSADEPRLKHILVYVDVPGRLERLLTHGRGLSLLEKPLIPENVQPQAWQYLEDDTSLLQNYMEGDVLESFIVKEGAALLLSLRRVIKTKDSAGLAEAKAGYLALKTALEKARV